MEWIGLTIQLEYACFVNGDEKYSFKAEPAESIYTTLLYLTIVAPLRTV